MDEEDIEDVDEDYILASRLQAGLFTLQQSALIVANLWFYNDVNLRKRILLLLHQQARAPPCHSTSEAAPLYHGADLH